jgi:hypothetical protein
MGTGMCASHTEGDCEEACRAHPDCELFVFYPEEKKGTCVLCRDLFSSDRTPDAATRAYAVGAAHKPPVPPGTRLVDQRFHVAAEPNPPPPPPRRSISPPPLSHLGRHHDDKSRAHVDCTFVEGVEYTVKKQTGYSDTTAQTKEECCALCGHHDSGCSNFVFEPSSGVCVLLPLVTRNNLERDDNEFVVSGTASVGVVAQGALTFPITSCSFTPNSGYSSGLIGPAPRLPGGEMVSREECCQSCGVTLGCARFTFNEASRTCNMYKAYAEIVMVNELTSGSIPSKLLPGVQGVPGVGEGAFAADTHSYLIDTPPAPALPSFAKLVMQPPPPPPEIVASSAMVVVSDFSMFAMVAMFLGLLLCVYLFFAPTLQSFLHSATNGTMGGKKFGSGGKYGQIQPRYGKLRSKKPSRKDRMDFDDDDDDDDDDDNDDDVGGSLLSRRSLAKAHTAIIAVADEPRGRKKRSNSRSGRRPSDRHREEVRSPSPVGPRAKLVVQTTSMSQSKDLDVSHCEAYDELRSLFFDEFPALLKGLRPRHMQLFCLAPPPDEPRDGRHGEEQLMWLLVTKESDFARVIECPAFRLQDERCDDSMSSQYVVAFVELKRPRGGKSGSRSGRKKQQQQPLLLGHDPSLDYPEPIDVIPDHRSDSGRSHRSHRSESGRSRRSESGRGSSKHRSSSRGPSREYSRDHSRGRYRSGPTSNGGRDDGSSSGEESIRSSASRYSRCSRVSSRSHPRRPGSTKGVYPPIIAPLNSCNLEHLSRQQQQPSPPRSEHSAWDDDDGDPESTGRSSRARGTARAELHSDMDD